MVTMTEHVSGILDTERFSAVLMTTLASVGLFLAAARRATRVDPLVALRTE